MEIKVTDLHYQLGSQPILTGLDFLAPAAQFTGIIGPNGSGKSTLIKNICRSLSPTAGKILVNAEDITKENYQKTAKKIATVGQENEIPFDFQVAEIVMMGRYPHKRFFTAETAEDQEIVQQAMASMGIAHLAKHNYHHLSGGEKQRVVIARGLAQQAPILLLDEPTNHLDIHYQLEIFSLLKKMDVTVVAAIHDLNLATVYCDYLYVLLEGEVYAAGKTADIITEKMLKEVFQVEAEVSWHPRLEKKVITYLPNE